MYNADEHWDIYFGKGINDIQGRLGNVILSDKDKLGRSSFTDKKLSYKRSRHPLAEKIASYDQWNLKSLNDYQSCLYSP